MHQHHDSHAHRDPDLVEEPLDAANQSLADALRASFGILKGIMCVLVILYLFSNVRGIGGHEEAMVLRLGKLRPTVKQAGLVWALPFPIDEIVRLPSRKSNDLTVTSHTFYRQPNEIGKPLSFISRGHGGLSPSLDGALLTADAGLVHVQWTVTYKIENVRAYISTFVGDQLEAADALILALVETVGIEVASELTAEEFVRTRVDYVQMEMKRRVNERMADLQSGMVADSVEMFEPTAPIQVREAFDRTQQVENAKKKYIQNAKQERSKILNKAAGAAHVELVALLDRLKQEDSPQVRAELDYVLVNSAEGRAGQMIRSAGAYMSVVVGQMESDIQEYRALVPEYERSPAMLVERLWEQTKAAIFMSPGVRKIFRPSAVKEFRVTISLDPQQSQIEETARVQKQEFDIKKLRPETFHPVGPEYD